MSIFGPQGAVPTRINEVQINQNVQGYPVPVVMGRRKLQQTILWVDGYTSKKIDSGGKGFGGKGNQYEYSADVVAALCAANGPAGIVGVGDVWSGQSWLPNTNTAEAFTVPSGSDPSYTPLNAEHMTADAGVGFTSTSTSATQQDLGSPASATVSSSDPIPLERVAYTSTNALTTGQYSVNPDDNSYHFSAADIGRSVQMSYSFALGTIQQQENGIIPSGLTILVGTATVPFKADAGVVWDNPSGDNDNLPLTKVSGTPTATGEYEVHTDGSDTATYTFYSGDVNQGVRITWKGDNSNNLASGTQKTLAFETLSGGAGQLPPSLLTTNFPDAAIGYPGIALAVFAPMDLGYGAQIQQNTYEVLTADAWGGGVADCNPVQCILQVLSNPQWGLGSGYLPFPTHCIDNGSGGTWGTGNMGNGGNGAKAFIRPVGGPLPGHPRVSNTATEYFAANGYFISPLMDRQDSAASEIEKWLEAGLCATFYSEGKMKLVPYGDTSASGNGVTWTAPTTFVAELDDTDFLTQNEGDEPVKVSSSPWPDAFNKTQVQWYNRQNQYAPEITPESDEAAINRYGLRTEDPQSWDFITTLNAARFAASVRVKRNVYTRNKYDFTVSWRHSELEPMDIISITTSNAWAAATANTMQLVRQPVRIIKTVDNPDGTIQITAEDYIFGSQQPSQNNKNTSTPAQQPNQYEDGGDTAAVFFVPPQRMTGVNNELWIGAIGTGKSWGGCNVWASIDGTKYAQIGTITAPARLGTVASSFPGGAADPDTTDTLAVELSPNCGALESATTSDADNGVTLCLLGGSSLSLPGAAGAGVTGSSTEIIAYSACALTGEQTYSMGTYIRRGLMGTSIPAGAVTSISPFLRLDDSLLKYRFDASWIGKTVYLKFQSFNAYGNTPTDLSLCPQAELLFPSTVTYTTVDGSGNLLIAHGAYSGGIK